MTFAPGPSELYFTVADHARKAFRDGILSMSHRSPVFEAIYRETYEGLCELLAIPSGFTMVFTSSASEIFERAAQNLVHETSTHLVNGAFSARFRDIATQVGKNVTSVEVALGEGFNDVPTSKGAEMIALTHNETSTGVSISSDFISKIRQFNPDALIVVDAVSSLPFPEFDFNIIDSVFFSVQKGFGLPAGLGVWLVNDRCIAKAEELKRMGVPIGTYHSLPALVSNARKNQTPDTPNVLGIYLLGKVVADFNRRGIKTIRNETLYKSTILYQCLENRAGIKPFVSKPADRSATVIVANTGIHTEALSNYLTGKGLQPGEGYGAARKSQLRFANFPAHSKEIYEQLVDALQAAPI